MINLYCRKLSFIGDELAFIFLHLVIQKFCMLGCYNPMKPRGMVIHLEDPFDCMVTQFAEIFASVAVFPWGVVLAVVFDIFLVVIVVVGFSVAVTYFAVVIRLVRLLLDAWQYPHVTGQ